MKKILIVSFFILLFFNSCALEIANIIGPGGGFVFMDTQSYGDKGWRYVECAPVNAGRLGNYQGNVKEADEFINTFNSNSFGGFNDWRLPDDNEIVLMLKSFTWELTRFSPDFRYLSASGRVYRCNFESNIQGDVEEVERSGSVIIRLVRNF